MRIKMKDNGGVVRCRSDIIAIVPRILVHALAYEIFRLILQNSNNITLRAATQESTILRSVSKNNFNFEIKSELGITTRMNTTFTS